MRVDRMLRGVCVALGALAVLVTIGCESGNSGGGSNAGPADAGEVDAGEDTGQDATRDTVTDAPQDAAPDTHSSLDPHTRPLEARLEPMVACVEALVADDNDTSGVAVAVLEDGEVAWSRGFGTVSNTDDRPVHDTTLFRFGSVLKMMSSTALLALVDEGRLTRDTPVSELLPALELDHADVSALTPHLLMTHQGGFEDYVALGGSADDAELEAFALSEAFRSGRFLAPPGSFYNYANPNYSMVGLLAETLDEGRTYRETMRARVFDPLGMDRTRFLAEDVLADGDFAYGAAYDRFGQRVLVTPDAYANAWGRPAGFGWSSVLDLARFARFVMHGNPDVLSDASWRALRSPQVDTRQFLDLASYGYGLSVNRGFFLGETFYDAELLSHTGAIPGYGAHMYIVPETGFAVVLLVNSLLVSPGPCVAYGLAAEMERWPEGQPPDLTVDPSTFDALEGSFGEVTGRVGPFQLRVRGGRVELVAPELDRVGYAYERVLEPISPDNFIWNTSQGPIVLTAIREDDGSVDYIRARIFVGVREEGEGKPRPPAARDRLGELGLPPALREPERPGLYRRGGW